MNDDVEFEWDFRKAESNIANHGVSFEIAVQVFFDDYVITEEDGFSVGEYRSISVGRTSLGIITVVSTERRDNVIRIITARPANPREKRLYLSGTL